MASPEQTPLEIEIDKPQEACGIVGVYAPDGGAVEIAHGAIKALNHRGQDGWGYSYIEKNGTTELGRQRLLGRVVLENVSYFPNPNAEYQFATAHARYGTFDADDEREALQPTRQMLANGREITAAHNGHFGEEILERIAHKNEIELGGTDSETFSRILGKYIDKYGHIEPAFHKLLPQLEGAFNLSILTDDAVYAVRDRHGLRPLVKGQIESSSAIVIASEAGGLDAVGADFHGEIEPGTYVAIDSNGIRTEKWAEKDKKICIFEKTYLSKPENIIEGQRVSEYRLEAGQKLAEVLPVEGDMVVPVLGSAKYYATGYAQAAGIDYEDRALIKNPLRKNPDSDRTFIAKAQNDREKAVRDKFLVDVSKISDKKIILVDDSLVRGTTMKTIISMLKEAGAGEVHVRIGSDKYVKPCRYGVNVQTEEELLATGRSTEEMCREIHADSLAFLPLGTMREAAISGDDPNEDYCDGCMGGEYPETQKQKSELSLATS